MRCAIVESGVAVNIARASAEFAAVKGWIVSDTARVGDLWDGVAFTTPPPTAEQIAAAADAARLADLEESIAADNLANALRAGPTMAQIDQYFANNVTTLAQSIALQKRLVKIMVRRKLLA